MKLSKLIHRSLIFYKKQHLALLIGTIISTAVLTGALIIGDSVRGSLHSLVDKRLGNKEYVLQSGDRFVTNELANKISAELEINSASLLQLKGIAINSETDTRINKVQVLGIDNSFWELSNLEIGAPLEDEVYISQNIAKKLELSLEDELLLRVSNVDVIPLNAPFAEEKDATISFRLIIKRILSDHEMGRYSLQSDQKAPFNVFVNQSQLDQTLDLEDLVNTILAEKSDQINAELLNESLKKSWNLEDAGLFIRELKDEKKYEVLSKRIFIDESIALALNELSPIHKILTYLINSIRNDTFETPYSFVSAISDYKGEGIHVNNWLKNDLHIKNGDLLTLKYFSIGPLRKLEVKEHSFHVIGFSEIDDGPYRKSLMPEFPGLADAGSCSDWNTGVPIDLDKIRDKDEDYWDEFKGTPKAVISLELGQKLWGNKYGQYTSFRFGLDQYSEDELADSILSKLNPAELNLSFINARGEGKLAAKNSVDFGELFLSLSFFVILAGVLLTILLFALNTASRSQETAILASIGYRRKKILKIRLIESSVVMAVGSLLGVGFGILYNQLLLSGLNSVWQDAVKTNMLSVHLKASTLLIGGLSGLVISFLSIYFVTRNQLKQQLASSLKKQNNSKSNKINWSLWISWTGFAGAIGLVVYSIIDGVHYNASAFLLAGFLMLIGIVLTVNRFIGKRNEKSKNANFSLKSLVFKNLGLHQKRNIATISLLALGTFAVIITGANRKTFYGVENDNQSGTGGYLFWAETSIPILHDLNSEDGIERFGLDDTITKDIEFHQMQVVEGNDASCLNLNLVQNPQILGVNYIDFINRSSFSFTKGFYYPLINSPWMFLKHHDSNNIYSAIVDQTVLTWGLMKEVGDTLFYKDEFGEQIGFIIVGALGNSIFQGNILVSNKVIQKHFPTLSGSKIMLVDGPTEKKIEIEQMLNEQFIDRGIEISSTSQRLAEFNSVTNSYLTVFMMLGGLGILIGTIGLGIVLLRNLQDRKYELALLKALGYQKNQIFKLIITENLLILFLGLITGIIAAFIGILPSLLSPSFTLPYGFVLLLLGSILLVGFLSIYLTAKGSLKRNYLEHLRRE